VVAAAMLSAGISLKFNFAVCSHRVSALDCARDIAKTREATP
jgi:hypothetical protein